MREAPIDKLLIETDSPYLAPIPFRGKKNEPAYIVHTAAAVAALKGLTAEDVGRVTAVNAMRFYDIDAEVKPALAYPIRDSLYVNLTSQCTLACSFCPKSNAATGG